MKVKRIDGSNQQRTKRTPRRNRRKQKSNENNSATSDLIEKVLNMLQGTADDEDTKLFREIDLAILGAPSIEYEKYSQNVMLEYASDEYQKDRLKMLKTLLTIPNIFTLEIMRDKFEATARQNIQAEIEKLSGQ